MLTTTLKDIRAARPCEDGWENLLNHMGVSPTDAKSGDHRVNLDVVLDAVGFDDTLWVVDNVLHEDMLLRLFAADCAERVLHLFENERPNDNRPRKAIEATRDPNATEEQLLAACDAAWDAAWAAARYAAWAAAWDVAWDAERYAQKSRLLQYITHGESAAEMEWK